jgi:hypothetical protein
MSVKLVLARKAQRDTHVLLVAGVGMTNRGKLPASDAAISIRLPTDIIKRADALVAPLAHEAAQQGITRVGRSIVIKRALLEGLRVLEDRYRPSR